MRTLVSFANSFLRSGERFWESADFERGNEHADGLSSFLDSLVHSRILILDAENLGLDYSRTTSRS